MAEQSQGNSSFAKAFIPGLVIGLIIGGTVGALWVPMLEAKNGGAEVVSPKGTAGKSGPSVQPERPAAARPEAAPQEGAKTDTPAEAPKKDDEKKPEEPAKAPPK